MNNITSLLAATMLASLSTTAIAKQEVTAAQELTNAQMDSVSGGLLFWPSSIYSYGSGATSLSSYYDSLWRQSGYRNPLQFYPYNLIRNPGHMSFFGHRTRFYRY
jgi:hypothetical protein